MLRFRAKWGGILAGVGSYSNPAGASSDRNSAATLARTLALRSPAKG
jgi:hypothetical protein